MSGLSKVVYNKDKNLFITIPDEQLLEGSLQIIVPRKHFCDWSLQNHEDSYLLMQRVAQAWKSSNLTDQYLI